MRMDTLPAEFIQAIPVLEALENEGFEAYFVGGSVRDVLLAKKISDVDIATSAYPEEVKNIFKRTVDIGIEHGTVLVLHQENQYEITTFRTESTYQDYRRPDEVQFVRSLEDDLKRRDFTINALAMNKSGEVIDLFQGMTDLQNKTIRAVGEAKERFHEDALRMMRALRFASQLTFKIDSETLAAIKQHHQLLAKISVERIQIEFVKLMLGINREYALEMFITTNCYRYCPGFAAREEDLKKFKICKTAPFISEEMVWLELVYLFELSSSQVISFLKGWKCSNHLAQKVAKALTALNWRMHKSWNQELLYQSGYEIVELVEETLLFFNKPNEIAENILRYQKLTIHSLKDLAINGNELLHDAKIPAGPMIGKILHFLEIKVVNNELENKKDCLLKIARIYFESNQ